MTVTDDALSQKAGALDASKTSVEGFRQYGEYIHFTVYSGKDEILAVSPRFLYREFERYTAKFRVQDRTKRKRVRLTYTVYRGSRGLTTLSKWLTNVTSISKGILYIGVTKGGSLSTTVAKLRSSARVRYYRPRSGWARKNNLRPNPEQRNASFPNYYWDIGNNPNGSFQGNTTFISYLRTWSGVRTPGFGSLKKSELPVNPHSVTIREQPGAPIGIEGSYRTSGFPGHFWRTQYLFSFVRSPDYWSEVPAHYVPAYDRAVKRLIKTAGNQIHTNMAQNLAQVDQLIRLVATTTRRLVGSVSALKKGNLNGAVKALWQGNQPVFRSGGGVRRSNTLAENWLEMQYGWKPLLMDIEGSQAAISTLTLGETPVTTATASARMYLETNTAVLHGSRQKGTEIEFLESIVKIGLNYRIGNEMQAFLAQTGFTNPLNLAWEVLPFSFVADWFIPIGPYLETLSAWDGLVFEDGYSVKLTRRRRIGKMLYDFDSSFGPPWRDYGFGWAMGQGIRFDRVKLTTFPSLSRPRFKNPLSATHALNGIALVRAIFRR